MAHRASARTSSTRRLANKRRQSATLIALAAVGILALLYLIGTRPEALGLGAGTLFVVLVLMRLVGDVADKKISRQLKAERRALRGAKAEDEVEDLLSSLDENYVVLNDLSCPYGNIDHIVISHSRGLCLIETKSHWGRVEVSPSGLSIDGRPPEKDFIGQALRNAYWLRAQVAPILGNKPWITTLLVFTNAFVPHSPPIRGVHVLNKRFLLKELNAPGRGAEPIWRSRQAIEDTLVSRAAETPIQPREAA